MMMIMIMMMMRNAGRGRGGWGRGYFSAGNPLVRTKPHLPSVCWAWPRRQDGYNTNGTRPYRLTRLVESADKQLVDDCMLFVAFRSVQWHAMEDPDLIGPMPPCPDMIVCVQDLSASPKMQFLLPYKLGDNGLGPMCFNFPTPPFKIDAHFGRSRLTDCSDALGTVTSDEHCIGLLQKDPMWTIAVVTCKLVDGPNLLLAEVIGIAEPFVVPTRPRKEAVKPADLCIRMLESSDPLSRQSDETGGSLLGGPIGRSPGGVGGIRPYNELMETDSSDGDCIREEEAEAVDGLPADLLVDQIEEVAHVSGLGPEPPDDENADEPDAEDEEAAAPDVVTPKDMAEASLLDEGGYVSCSIGPYAGFKNKQIGRITDWPDSKPVPNRSVSVRCFLHGACSSSAVKRHSTSDARLLEWLYTARLEPGCTQDRKKELRQEHKDAFKDYHG